MICKNCDNEFNVKYSKYSNGNFCSKKCARSYSTKNNRDEIIAKISRALKGYKHSNEMREEVRENNKKRTSVDKDKIRQSLLKYFETDKGKLHKAKLAEIRKNIIVSDETRIKLGIKSKKRCEDIEVRKFMGKIGMNSSSWGYTGYTESGRFYQSLFEKKCFDFLDNKKILFENHKYLPNSSKICDIYILKYDIWIELDGIGRERRKHFLIQRYGSDINDYWDSKLKEYEDNNLNVKIFRCVSDFKKFILSMPS